MTAALGDLTVLDLSHARAGMSDGDIERLRGERAPGELAGTGVAGNVSA